MRIILFMFVFYTNACVSTENRPKIVDDQFQFSQSLEMTQAEIMKDFPVETSTVQARDHRHLPHFYSKTANRSIVVEMYGPANNVKLASLKRFMGRSDSAVHIPEFKKFTTNIVPGCNRVCLNRLFGGGQLFKDVTLYLDGRKLYVDWESRSMSLQITITPENVKGSKVQLSKM